MAVVRLSLLLLIVTLGLVAAQEQPVTQLLLARYPGAPNTICVGNSKRMAIDVAHDADVTTNDDSEVSLGYISASSGSYMYIGDARLKAKRKCVTGNNLDVMLYNQAKSTFQAINITDLPADVSDTSLVVSMVSASAVETGTVNETLVNEYPSSLRVAGKGIDVVAPPLEETSSVIPGSALAATDRVSSEMVGAYLQAFGASKNRADLTGAILAQTDPLTGSTTVAYVLFRPVYGPRAVVEHYCLFTTPCFFSNVATVKFTPPARSAARRLLQTSYTKISNGICYRYVYSYSSRSFTSYRC